MENIHPWKIYTPENIYGVIFQVLQSPPFTGFQFTGVEKYKIFNEIEAPLQWKKTTHGYKNLKTHDDGYREIYRLPYSLHRPTRSSIQQNIESRFTAEAMK